MLSKKNIIFWWNSIVHSYSQMFFSDNKVFAYLLMAATLVNVYSGITGLVAVIVSIGFAQWLGLKHNNIYSGYYSFNSLLLGLVMGLFFKFSITFFLLLFIFCFITVLLSNALSIFLAKYELPFLTLPFILAVWLLLLAVKGMHRVDISEQWLYTYNDLFSIGGMTLVSAYDFVKDIHLPVIIDTFFKSLGAIYFQYNIITGILIALGLLIYSRIAFSLSIIGFISGYYSYYWLNGNVEQLAYTYIGFNYVLAAVSIGGFYLVPSAKSYLLAIVMCAVIAVIQSGLVYFLHFLQLPMYSFPSSIVILLTLLTMRYGLDAKGLRLVPLQLYSPEKNLYRYLYESARDENSTYVQLALPFYGEWYVSQGQEGSITHIDDWKYAWDFVVTDEMKKTFRLPGEQLSDFFCYNAPITAPAPGYVIHINDDIEDNLVGNVNIRQNWGNTIIIRHTDGLFSKMSHLRQGSFKVKVGDYVNTGDVIALCGNSGRSPEPHIHFQLQSTPFVGSKTLRYPISYYITHNRGEYEFHSFSYPAEQATISNVVKTPLLHIAFGFVPGEKMKYEVITTEEGKEEKEIIEWEVNTNSYNKTYIFCPKSQSYAYFVNNDAVFYFTDFYGNKNSLLYQFFLSAHKILLGYYHEMGIKDKLPVNVLFSGSIQLLQDFVAPFHRFISAGYESVFTAIDDYTFPGYIKLETKAEVNIYGTTIRKVRSEITLMDNTIKMLVIHNGNKKTVATCLSD